VSSFNGCLANKSRVYRFNFPALAISLYYSRRSEGEKNRSSSFPFDGQTDVARAPKIPPFHVRPRGKIFAGMGRDTAVVGRVSPRFMPGRRSVPGQPSIFFSLGTRSLLKREGRSFYSLSILFPLFRTLSLSLAFSPTPPSSCKYSSLIPIPLHNTSHYLSQPLQHSNIVI